MKATIYELPTKEELLKEIPKVEVENITENSVVLIGSYSGSQLKIIRECLEEVSDSVAIEAKYVKDRHGMTPRQKLHAILSVCNFVIAEDSVPSGEMIELEYCRHTGAITAIMHTGLRSSYMTLDCDLHSPDFNKFPYKTNKEEVKKVVKNIIKWVKETKDKRQEKVKAFEKVKIASSKYCAEENCPNRKRNP